MKRAYISGNSESAQMFIGTEVEHTPAYDMPTLFVVGLQDAKTIDQMARRHSVQHIFFGANHSFSPSQDTPDSAREWDMWEDMIEHCLERGYWCSLDIPLELAEQFHESGLCEYPQFIPQIRVPVPYIGLWNYNTMIKIDDRGFAATNPGVWCHRLHTLMDPQAYTPWAHYRNDEIINETAN